MRISAVIITFNEENNIRRCLESLDGIVDEILVVDSFSTDNTAGICREKGVRFETNPFEGHIQQKNYAMRLATHDWILSLDADEALSDELRFVLIDLKSKENGLDAYQFNRLTNYCGKWIRHGGWYPDKKIRLWDRRKGKWGGVNPHDKVVLEMPARLGILKGDLLHYSYYNLGQHVAQIDKFSSIAARQAYDGGKRVNVFTHIIIGPFYSFVKKYIIQLGFLDGYYGFIIAISTGYYRFLKYIKLREIEMKNGD